MKIGILQTGHMVDEIRVTQGDVDAMFRRLLGGRGYDFDTYPVVDMIFPDGAGDADGWLITGSKHGVYEDHPWLPPLEALIREIRDAGLPMVGICFGHQVIAQALGGRVEKFAGGWSVGRTQYHMHDGTEIALSAWHQDQIVAMPPDAEVVGHTDFCAHAFVAYGDRILTMQPHPEFGDTEIAGLIAHRAEGVVPEPLIARARAGLGQPTDRALVTDRIASVFERGQPQ